VFSDEAELGHQINEKSAGLSKEEYSSSVIMVSHQRLTIEPGKLLQEYYLKLRS
jgi:hypothetical protein